MKRQQWGPYVVALAILVVGLAWVGVPASTLLVAGLVLACPLMMLVMMRGMHGGDMSGQDTSHNHDTPHEHHHHDATDPTNDPYGTVRRSTADPHRRAE